MWALLEDPGRWPEFEPFLRRVEGVRGKVRQGQHLMAVARGFPLRVPVDVRVVSSGRQLGLTVHVAPGLREQLDHTVTARVRGGSEIRVTAVAEGPFALAGALPLWVAGSLTARLLGWRATREHRRVARAVAPSTGVA